MPIAVAVSSEARILASLNHPNIAQIDGVEESHTLLALVMDLVEGPTLAEQLTSGPMPLVPALRLARQVVAALETAHEKGIIHRDLKPANIKNLSYRPGRRCQRPSLAV